MLPPKTPAPIRVPLAAAWRGGRATSLALLLLAAIGSSAAQALEFHVAPTGSDANPGTAVAPFATPEKARGAIRASVRDGSRPIVWLHGGDYFRTTEFALSELDNNCIYQAAPNETPRFIGGVKLDPAWFTPVTSASPVWGRLAAAAQGKVMEVDLAAHGITDYGTLLPRGFNMSNIGPMELLVNTKPQKLARWPNAGSWATNTRAVNSTSFTYSGTQPSRWSQAEEIWVHGNFYYDWADYAVPVTSINTATSTITVPATAYGIASGSPYFVFNLLEEIDTAGEYYIKRDTGKLYYWPAPGFNTADVLVTVMSAKLFSVTSASDITVDGVEFVGARSRLAQIISGTNVVFQRCRFLATGTDAVSISGTNSGLYNCEIADTGSGGVALAGGDRLTLTPGGNYARQCLIHDLSRLSFTYNPGVRLNGVGQIAEHCEIYNNTHAAIIFSGNDHRMEYNNIHDVCTATNDAGAIYCGRDWGLRGNLIRYNFIHDIKSSLGGDVHAIYLDDCGSGVTSFGNVIYRVSGRAMLNGGGRDNIWTNNVVAKCTYFHFGDTRGPANITNTPGSSWNLLEKLNAVNYQNPPWSTAYPALAAIPNDYTKLDKYPRGVVLSRNVSWQNTNYIVSTTAASYYAEKLNNLNGQDPRFVDEAALDLTLRADSPALAIPGFQPIAFKDIGRTVSRVTWDADAGTPAAQDGTGTWRTGSGANWWNGAAQIWDGGLFGYAYANLGAAVGASPFTVTLGSNVALRGLTFANQLYTIGSDPGGLFTLTLTDEAVITTVANGVIGARIGGAGGLVKAGGGKLTLSGTNSYTGTTTIGGGTLALSGGDNRLPATGSVNFSTAGTLDLGSTRQTLAKLTTDNSVTGTVKGTGGTLALSGVAFQLGSATSSSSQTLNLTTLSTFTYLNPTQPFHVGGLAIIGSNGASGTLTGALTTTLTAASVGIGTGGVGSSTANAGTLKLGKTTGINTGTLMIGANYRSNGTLQYPSGTTNPTLTLRGTDGVARVTSLLIGDNNGPTVATSGTVDLTTNVTGVSTLDARIDTAVVGRNSRTSSAGGNFIQVAGSFSMGAGTLDVTALTIGQVLAGFINGGTTSSASGTLTVGGGTVKVATLSLGDHLSAANANSGPCAGTFNLNSGSTLAAQTIKAGAGASNTTRTFNWNDGTIKNYDASTDLNFGAGLTTCALLGTGLHAFAIDSGRQATIQQALSGAGGLTKLGIGTLTLNAANTYTGTTSIEAGTLALVGSLTSSITNSAVFAPQGSAVTSGSFTQTTTGTLQVRIAGTTVGSGYDQLKTAGPVNLAGALDVIAAPGFAVGTSFTLIDQTGAAPVAGTFAGLAEGTAFYADSQWWRISYTGGTGNDVVVTRIAASAWQTWQAQNFGASWADPLVAGDAVDFDRDGTANILEYALGTDPTATTSSTALTQASIEAGRLTLTFNRNTAATDVTIIVQGTDSLTGTWTDLASSINGAATSVIIGGVPVSDTGTGASRTVKVGDRYLANDAAHPSRFLRLKVVRP